MAVRRLRSGRRVLGGLHVRKEEAIADRLMAITDYLQALADEGKIDERDAKVLIERSEDCLKMIGWTK